MTRKLGADDERLLAGLYDRLRLTLQFFENAQEFNAAPFLAQVEKAFERRDLRGMRIMARETDQMTIALTPDQRDGLEALLRTRLGIDKDAERERLRERVAETIKRGSVASEKERRRLEDYAEMLEATGGDPKEIEMVRHLISTAP